MVTWPGMVQLHEAAGVDGSALFAAAVTGVQNDGIKTSGLPDLMGAKHGGRSGW